MHSLEERDLSSSIGLNQFEDEALVIKGFGLMSCGLGHNGHPGKGRCREQRKPGQPAEGGRPRLAHADLAANANVTAGGVLEQAKADRLGFWAEQARRLTWATEPTKTLDWSNPPFAKWFAKQKLNVAYNCVNQPWRPRNGDRVAIHFEGEPGDSRAITYADSRTR